MPLPDGFLQELKFKTDINDVVSTYVTLKKRGNTYVGLCPFHNEKTPSFTVYPATQSFYCFGCGAGGDAVTGAATVILAMGAGKKAAAAIDEYIKNKK